MVARGPALAVLGVLWFYSCLAEAQDSNKNQRLSKDGVLQLIEIYSPPSHPNLGGIDRETYDYRIAGKASVPPDRTSTFVCDIGLLIADDLKLTLNPETIELPQITKAITVYTSRDWKQIPGLRPWTFFHFVRRLDDSQRRRLADEVKRYMTDKPTWYRVCI